MAYLEVFSISEESFFVSFTVKPVLSGQSKKAKHWHHLTVDEIVYYNHILAVL